MSERSSEQNFLKKNIELMMQRRDALPDDAAAKYQMQFESSVHEHKLRFVGRSWSWQCDGQDIGDGCKRRGQYQKTDRYRW